MPGADDAEPKLVVRAKDAGGSECGKSAGDNKTPATNHAERSLRSKRDDGIKFVRREKRKNSSNRCGAGVSSACPNLLNSCSFTGKSESYCAVRKIGLYPIGTVAPLNAVLALVKSVFQ